MVGRIKAQIQSGLSKSARSRPDNQVLYRPYRAVITDQLGLMIKRQYSKLCEMHAQRQCPKRSRSSTERGKNLDAVRDLLTLPGPR
ncbi:hypothetical protein RRG08_017082 [Elysia crispata]|uniref:Uncharacterized protein n=1 Tax=Elysia crispata TaxID=231223 RepID=A0AAE1DMG4_9GAST|nr:hypothetical protein RRG08_017082 [Elysia crispata]